MTKKKRAGKLFFKFSIGFDWIISKFDFLLPLTLVQRRKKAILSNNYSSRIFSRSLLKFYFAYAQPRIMKISRWRYTCDDSPSTACCCWMQPKKKKVSFNTTPTAIPLRALTLLISKERMQMLPRVCGNAPDFSSWEWRETVFFCIHADGLSPYIKSFFYI